MGELVPWFGRDGLLTRNPSLLISLSGDGVSFGSDRLYPPKDMIEWIIMKRCGLDHTEAREYCRSEDPQVTVYARRTVTYQTAGGLMQASEGSSLEFSYKAGLIRTTASTGVLADGDERAADPGDRGSWP